MTSSQHIMVVDDEAQIREMVGDYLRLNGFQVTLCDDGRSLRQAIDKAPPDLIVLDLQMQEEDGLSIIRALKERTGVPIIMFSGNSDPIDKIVGLEVGADDYLAKGSELRELLARIRSVLRRTAVAPTPAEPAGGPAQAKPPTVPTAASPGAPRRIRLRTTRLDLEAQVLRDDEGMEHALVGTEFALLKAFAENPRRVLSRERLLDLAGARDEAFDRSIDVRINRIRKKIDTDPDRT